MSSLAALKNRLSEVTGAIKVMPVNSIPDGWLALGGSAVSRTTYSKLFALIGTTYGVGDGSTTFTLPAINGSGRFIRGTGGNAAAVGTAQADRTKKNGLTATASASSVTGTTNIAHGHGHNITGSTTVNYLLMDGAVSTGDSRYTLWNRSGSGGTNSSTGVATTISGGVTSLGTSNIGLDSGTAAAQSITIATGDVETNPLNYAMVYCIKY